MNIELLDELASVFDWQPDPAQYFATPATELVRQGLRRSLSDGSGIPLLTGAAGAGKTLLLQLCLQDMPGRFAHIAQLSYTSMSGAEILRSMAYAFGMSADVKTDAIAPMQWTETQLRQWAGRGEASLLVIDEAQNLPLDALQPLLALSQLAQDGRALLRMVLVGRPLLLELLAAPALIANAAAIGPQFSLQPLQPRESAAYIAEHLAQLPAPGRPSFTAAVLDEIHHRTQGRPGQINLLCKQLLQMAILLENDAVIDVSTVAAQADELGFHAEPTGTPPMPAHAPTGRATAFVTPARQPLAPAKPAVAPSTAPRRRRSPVRPISLLLAAAIGLGIFLQAPLSPSNRGSEPGVSSAVSALSPGRPPSPPSPVPPLSPATPAMPPSPAPPTPPPRDQPLASLPVPTAQLTPRMQAQPKAPGPPPRTVAAPPARTAATSRQPAASPSARTDSRRCAQLLAQLSLGEPLNTRQKQTLDSSCR